MDKQIKWARSKFEACTTNNKQGSLIAAIWSNNVDLAKSLILAGANVSMRDDTGLTPLHHAAMQNADGCADLLISNGCDALACNRQGQFASNLARSFARNPALVDRLLQAELDQGRRTGECSWSPRPAMK